MRTTCSVELQTVHYSASLRQHEHWLFVFRIIVVIILWVCLNQTTWTLRKQSNYQPSKNCYRVDAFLQDTVASVLRSIKDAIPHCLHALQHALQAHHGMGCDGMVEQPSFLLLSFPPRAAEGQTTASGHSNRCEIRTIWLSFRKFFTSSIFFGEWSKNGRMFVCSRLISFNSLLNFDSPNHSNGHASISASQDRRTSRISASLAVLPPICLLGKFQKISTEFGQVKIDLPKTTHWDWFPRKIYVSSHRFIFELPWFTHQLRWFCVPWSEETHYPDSWPPVPAGRGFDCIGLTFV